MHIYWDSPSDRYEIVWMSNVQCRGNETSISTCRHERLKEGNCSIGKYAGVTCEGKIMKRLGSYMPTQDVSKKKKKTPPPQQTRTAPICVYRNQNLSPPLSLT
ncbi:hypothetical protein HOLleu_26136 [Holothuria leucospilota]|uniref:SRCR domain-containing protein n=1 Tax=Holothuria leucospilota TaxID=206669 RepID=A0A9Q1BTK4_HOLLE|nr:hypothetical protein HOLleu_26136 [Holothuria leucospilota]